MATEIGNLAVSNVLDQLDPYLRASMIPEGYGADTILSKEEVLVY